MKVTYLLLLACSIPVVSCVHNSGSNILPTNEPDNFCRIIVNPSEQIDTCYNADLLFDSVAFVKLSNEPEAMVSSIEQMIVKDSLIIISNRYGSGVKLFSDRGCFKGNVGQYGRGPGEYIEPTHIDCTDDEILVWDQFAQRINYYDLNGKFINSRETKYFSLKCHQFDSNSILFNSVNSDNDKSIKNYSLFLCDSSFNVTATNLFKKHNSYRSIWNNHDFFSFGSDVYYQPVYCDTIYSVSSDCSCKPVFYLDFGERSVPKHLRTPAHKRERKKAYESGQYCFSMGDFFITDDYLLFEYINANKTYYGFYSKKSSKLVCFNYWSVNKIYPARIENFMTSTHKAFVGYVFPAAVSSVREGGISEAKREGYSDFYGKERADLICSLKEDDNPVITFFYPSL